MNKNRKNTIKNQIIFLLIFFAVISILILLNYYNLPIQIFIFLVVFIIYIFAAREMIKEYKKGWIQKRLFGWISSRISIKKHPIRTRFNFIFINLICITILIFLIYQILLFFKII